MAKNKNMAKISNGFLESFMLNNNATALKMIFYISKSGLVVDPSAFMHFKIDIKALCDYCNIDVKTLRRNLKQLTEVSVALPYEKGVRYISLLPYVDIGHNGVLEVKMFKEILDELIAVQSRFTVIDVRNIMALTSKNSLKMIQLLERINGYSPDVPKRKRYTLEELNSLFGVKYGRLGLFVAKILEPVRVELTSYSKLTFSYSIEYDKKDLTSPGRPKAVAIVIDLLTNHPQPSLF